MNLKINRVLKKLLFPISSLALLVLGFPLLALASTNVIPSGPMVGHWCIDGVIGCDAPMLSQWSPNNLISSFYQNKTPLAKVVYLNNNQDKADIIPYIDFNPNTPIQMQVGVNNLPEIMFWNYIPAMVYFGGSLSGGQVEAPAPQWIKIAHQNGVKIFGTIFFSPVAYGGGDEITALNNFISQDALGHYPMADKLIAIAKAYGFDGYFINEETITQTNLFNQFQGFINYFNERCKQLGLHLSLYWYQVPAYSLDTNLLMDNGNMVSGNAFLDYSWQDGSPATLAQQAQSIGYPIKDLEFGIYAAQQNTGSQQQYLFQEISPNQQLTYGSIAEFAYEQILTQNNNQITFQQEQQNAECFWLGTNCVGGNGGWTGAAQYVANRTAITALPFSIFFNTGQGSNYFINGNSTDLGAWSDIGSQNYLANLADSSTTAGANNLKNQLSTAYDYNTAYDGGSSLAITGNVTKGSTTTDNLYATQLTLAANDLLNVEYQTNASSVADVSICLNIGNQASCFPLVSNANGSWQNANFSLASLAGKTISGISFQVTGLTASDFSLNLGEIFIGDAAEAAPPVAPTHVHVVKSVVDNNGNLNTYIAWNSVTNATYYNINENGNLLMVRHQPIVDIITKPGQINLNDISICATNSDGQQSPCSQA